MTKERLEELIKQGATVLVKTLSNRIIKVNTKAAEIDVIDDKLYFNDGKWFPIKDIYFDEAELQKAEWHNKTYAERTERFEPPMWDDIENEYKIDFIEQPDKPIYFYASKEINVIFIRDVYEDELIEIFDATKENYEKACEIVRDLFVGEK